MQNSDGSLKTSAIADAGGELTSSRGQPGGYTPLDGAGQIATAYLPSVTDAMVASNAAIAQSKVSGLSTSLTGKVDKSLYTAKGDVIIGTGAGAVQAITIGADGRALVADATQPTGVKWADVSVNTSAFVQKGDALFNVKDYGALGDGKRLTGVTSSSASASVTVSTGTFTNADIGKIAAVYTNGAAGTITTIQSVQSATQITLATSAGITTSVGLIVFGTDNSTAIQSAINAAATSLNFESSFVTNPNQPMGMGNALVTVPSGTSQATYMITTHLTIPAGVAFDCTGIIVNALADRFDPCIVVQPYGIARRLFVEALFGAGVQAGTVSNSQAHVWLGDVRVWHVGTSIEVSGLLRSQDGLILLGYHFEVGGVFIKGGYHGIYHNAGSDCAVNYAYVVGCKTGVHMNISNQVHYSSMFVDSCTGVNAPFGGLVIDNACSNIYANVQAFEVIGTSTSCNPVVGIGQINSGVNKDIVLDIQANNTGGVALAIANTQEATIRLHAGNTQFASGVNNPITTAVVYGSGVSTPIQIEANLSGSITPFSGTVIGTYRYSQSGTYFHASPMQTSNVLVKPANNATNVLQVQNSTATTIFDVDNQNNRVGVLTSTPDQALTVNNGTINVRLAPPGSLAATPSASGGTLASNTYFYQAIALDAAGGTTVASNEASAVVTGPNGSVSLTWSAVTGAASYRVYRGTSTGGENVFYTSATNSFTDTGAANTSGSIGSPTASVVKFSPNGNSWLMGGNVGIGTATPVATLSLGGGVALKRTGVADANYTVLASDYMIAYTSLSTGRTVTLPTPGAGNTNQMYIIKDQSGNAGTNNITISSSGGATIDGAASKVINTAWGVLKVYTNGTNWFTM